MSADNYKNFSHIGLLPVFTKSTIRGKGIELNTRTNMCNKKVAFTLAELMVIMSVMTVILAAVAPIFTSRFTNASFDNAWSTVGASNTNDIYADAPIRSMMQEVMIGITPKDLEDVRQTYKPYSKLIIRSGNKINGNKLQKQIEFRYNGTTQGYLFAGNANLLLGGKYPSISLVYNETTSNDKTKLEIGDGASANTSMGVNALNAITTGKNNSAFGSQALNNLTTGSENTAIGRNAGQTLTTGTGNVFVGYNSYNSATGNYNTIIGNNPSSKSDVSNYTTAVGNNINVKGDYNTAIGDSSNAGGLYNTAIGYGALASKDPASDSYTNFESNTAIGYKSCSGISSSAQNTTCIGGVGINNTVMSSTAISLFNDNKSRVLIGRPTSKYNSAATLEVHSLATSANSKYPYPNDISGAPYLSDSSVIVNGNLIVRGQTYMIGRSPFPISPAETNSSYSANTISLMGYRLYKESVLDHKPLIGLDGNEYFRRLFDNNRYRHQNITGREHCICAYSCTPTAKDYQVSGFRGRDSYDWSSRMETNYRENVLDSFGNPNNFYQNTHFCGNSFNSTVNSANSFELNNAHTVTNAQITTTQEEISQAQEKSCCPMLEPDGYQVIYPVLSDKRLKNIKSPFDKGLAFLNKLKIYNFTYKSDKYKNLQVGVMAQDLKRVFPDSVSKNSKGYYQIRIDEMFYSAVNSVKELNNNINTLVSKINDYVIRINNLKKENLELKNRLLLLSNELDKLEK